MNNTSKLIIWGLFGLLTLVLLKTALESGLWKEAIMSIAYLLISSLFLVKFLSEPTTAKKKKD